MRQIVAVYSKNHTERVRASCGRVADFLYDCSKIIFIHKWKYCV